MWAVGGNCVVLDHGNGEFSFLGHMQKGSVRVEKGGKVKQGQVLGLLGSSGSAQGPHLHYHLMAGGVIFHSDGLPSRFVNVSDGAPRQGRYSEAK
jgi:murein DD-endopeptidase MepM/ murein hydrolase activator NlpD